MATRVLGWVLLLLVLTTPTAQDQAQATGEQAHPRPVRTVAPVTPRPEPGGGNLPLTLLGAISLLLVLIPARRLMIRRAPRMLGFTATPGAPVRPVPVPGKGPLSALSFEESLDSATGVGVVGAGATGFMRAALVELLTRVDRKVVLSRTELNRLFGGAMTPDMLGTLSPGLHVCAHLDDAVAYLEREPGLVYWIATPGDEDGVVLSLLRREALRGLLFGHWPHGPTAVVNVDGTIPDGGPPVPTLTAAEALERLRLYALTHR
ncbi:MAG: hypothetical protein ABIS86_08310 [Streptosporangiaceae bacterium]